MMDFFLIHSFKDEFPILAKEEEAAACSSS